METEPAPTNSAFKANNGPAFELIEEEDVHGIKISDWVITSRKQPISDSAEISRMSAVLGIPLPEMMFGNNYLRFEHSKGFSYTFEAFEALKRVGNSAESAGGISVSYAKHWAEKRDKTQDVKRVINPYDWTYTTDYRGTLCSPSFPFNSTTQTIDIERLKLPEPILFYDHIVLYEDELADNGSAILSIKIRVMPTGFFILQRFFLRVDDVLFRVNDTRLYHAFDTSYLIKEYTFREEPYINIRKKIPVWKKDDISLLSDPNWVVSVMPPADLASTQIEMVELDSTQ
ncbi:TIP41-domain-containing protein [Basidiobolus meristosporus CBS 931.73]|uniref:TIP41-domain-containing protein n=1 Tax=Basidiobolus meristosporus CBS 931.73 TaxID=1314790 RepID=A0A1Y1Y3H4_9FUNG|nr:TIP41-domain-containing protein [Basidiobolus meristosporus CBS 931.73]|eukprot:ORX92582.1 TIP41-domain-containing protein [Basidiobolus meristosporus CBS 931.73]